MAIASSKYGYGGFTYDSVFWNICMHRVEILQVDITTLAVDAIVNAANEWMLGGGGVDGAIHRAAGPELRAACRAVPEVAPGVRCPTGECRITPGFELPAQWVIHTVGPVWHGGDAGEPELLARCYRGSLELARERGLSSIAFPAISCGAYGYPIDKAAAVVRDVLANFLRQDDALERVVLAVFDEEVRLALADALQQQ